MMISSLTDHEGFFSPETLRKRHEITADSKKLNLEVIND